MDGKGPSSPSESGRGPSRSPRLYESLGNVPPNVEITFVTDRRGDVWRIVRDGGMAARITVHGELESAGVRWLRDNLGPLVAFDPMTFHRDEMAAVR